MMNDFDYIKSRFAGDDIKAPDSLSEDNVLAMLLNADKAERDSGGQADAADSVEFKADDDGTASVRAAEDSDEVKSAAAAPRPSDFRPVRTGVSKRTVRRVIAAAACLLIAVTGGPKAYNIIAGVPDTSLVNGELRSFESYGEIERLVDDIEKKSDSGFFSNFNLGSGGDRVYESDEKFSEDMSASDGSGPDFVDLDNGPTPLAGSPDGSADIGGSPGDASRQDHSDTYLQVEEVDEADIVKTDGKYIYYVNERQEVVIYSADKGKAKKVSTIGSSGVENYIEDIFLQDDKLVTIGRVYKDDDGYTGIVVYDISDRTSPEVVGEFRQSGDIVSSRMIGNYVYLVTTEWVYKGSRIIPKCTVNGKYDKLPVNDICSVPDPNDTSYVVLSAVDISSGKNIKSKSKAVFGASDTIYCNDHRLYAAVNNWNYNSDSGEASPRTLILRAELDGLNVKWSRTGTVRGYIDNQFSMDEKDGYFRIATTSQRNGMYVNNLFVLDDKLKVAGEVSGFARNESIRSVRYIGDKAYVITYEEIDPLFVIDLSNPVSPVIEGEVKIDGFSTLLVPVNEDKLLGIGYATGDNGYGGEYAAGLKLALFDISNPSDPKVADSKEFKDMESPAQNTHLALLVNRTEGWYALPYTIPHYDEDPVIVEDYGDDVIDGEEITDAETQDSEDSDNHTEAGVMVFEADRKLKVKDQHELSDEYLTRSVYIGDYIYAFDSEGNVYSFKY